MTKVITVLDILMLMVLTACSASAGENTAAAAQIRSRDAESSAPQLNENNAEALQPVPSAEAVPNAEGTTSSEQPQSGDNTSSTRLNEGYVDALPVQIQLALGTMLLDDSDLAIDGEQAAALLPLWQAVQSLTTSGTAADAEISAVFSQIQAGMTTEQFVAIADMQLTQEALRSLVQEGVIAIDVGDVKRGSTDDAAGGGARGGGPPGGGGGALGGQVDHSRQATRQAEGGGNDLLNQAVTSAVVKLLELKTT